MLNNAGSIEELNMIAADYESSLMWKMLGPHQGLRLERMRTEIERDKFGDQLKSLPELKNDVEPMAPAVVSPSSVASTDATGPPDASVKAQKSDENGYEWYTDPNGANYYRATGSEDEWQEFNG